MTEDYFHLPKFLSFCLIVIGIFVSVGSLLGQAGFSQNGIAGADIFHIGLLLGVLTIIIGAVILMWSYDKEKLLIPAPPPKA